ncbi:hypothetical protein C1646_720847, partial [Rhizophagus diaphanus]
MDKVLPKVITTFVFLKLIKNICLFEFLCLSFFLFLFTNKWVHLIQTIIWITISFSFTFSFIR